MIPETAPEKPEEKTTCERCIGDGEICEECDKASSLCECDIPCPYPCEECDGNGEIDSDFD